MKVGVVTFPGSLDDVDAARAARIAGHEAVALWHGDHDLRGVDAVVLPGGFSYGDYLRCGAISRFAPVMTEVVAAARGGLPVLGICNGFQILCESHLLPGALIRNDHRKFVCRDQRLRVENTRTAWTSAYDEGAEITVVLKNGEGSYVADEDTLDRLEGEGRVVVRYLDGNPNGSQRDIAGITNEAGNVVGLMPHPEHAVEDLCGPGTDGLGFFTSLLGGPSRRELRFQARGLAARSRRLVGGGGSWILGYRSPRPSRFQLLAAITPVTGSPTCCCQARTAASVVASNTPVTGRRAVPAALSARCTRNTPGPADPIFCTGRSPAASSATQCLRCHDAVTREAVRLLPRLHGGGQAAPGALRHPPDRVALLAEQAAQRLRAAAGRRAGHLRVLREVHADPAAVALRCCDRSCPEIQVVPVDVDGHPAPCLVMTTDVLLHPAAGPPAVLAEVRRGRVGPAVPPRDPDPVREHDQAGPLDPGVVERLQARPGGRVDAGDVAELVQPGRPAAEEPQRRLAAGGVGDVEALEVVPQRAPGGDAQRLGVDHRRRGLGEPLGERGGVRLVGARRRVDLHVVGVAREPRLAGRLRARA